MRNLIREKKELSTENIMRIRVLFYNVEFRNQETN